MNTRTENYRFTLPVVHGIIQDDGRLDTLRQRVAYDNGKRSRARRTWPTPTLERRRYVVDLKYRGPRHGSFHRTPVWAAYAVDVYVRLRRDW